MLFALLLVAGQAGPLPPAALPAPATGTDQAAVMAPIDRMTAAIARGDAAGVLAQVRAEGSATMAREGTDGTRTIRRSGWAEFVTQIKPGPPRIEERISDPAIEVDGDIAMVWAPYVLTIDGRPDHCGFDHFDLVREGGAWKILNVTWSERTTGCTLPR